MTQVNHNSITGIGTGNYDPKVFTADNFANNAVNVNKFASNTKGCIRKITHFHDNTVNISDSNNNSNVIITFNFTRSSSSNAIVAIGYVPQSGSTYSHLVGSYVEIDSTGKKFDMTNWRSATNGSDGQLGIFQIQGCWTAGTLGSGTSHTFKIGKHPRDGGNHYMGGVSNPFQTSSRHRSNTTQITLFETDQLNFFT